ncbi:MAG: enoyl-CoA hydratase/isomerase family protein [Actinomycetota bacterium]
MGGPVVLVERTGPRVNVILNRPERKNSVTAELAVELRDALRSVNADGSVGCIVLQGADGVFCSGIDLKAAGDGQKPAPLAAWPSVHAELYRCGVPVVAALEKYAINAGAALALAAHVVVAGEASFMQVSEIAIGVAAPMNQAWLHLRHSPAVADRLTLLADRIAAPELLRLGVVTEVVADDAVLARANELGDRIAAYPVSGREGIARTWKRLRGTIEDPESWFASLAAR